MSKHQNAITRSAKGEPCMIRIPQFCTHDNSTTVFCHKNGAGLATKENRIQGSYGCSVCHDIVDWRMTDLPLSKVEILMYFYEGIFRTQLILIKKGLITTPEKL